MLIRENFPAAVRRPSHSVKACLISSICLGRRQPRSSSTSRRGAAELHYVRKIIESGGFRLETPQNYAAMATDIAKWGEFGMLPSFNARRTPHRAAIIDEDG